MSMPAMPLLLNTITGVWENEFWDDFSDPSSLDEKYFHPMSVGWRENPANKWKWDAHSNKEIHWDFTCSSIISDAEGHHLRVCVYSDWFHRIDRLATKALFGYGYFEARIRFRGAEGMHAAFWLLPDAMDGSSKYPPGEIPGGIEVDVVEHRAFDGQRKSINQIGNTATHWSGYGPNHQSAAYSEISLPKPCENWSLYSVLHDETGISWFWDGKLVNRAIVRSSVPNHMYFSTEVNESGGWAGNDPPSYGPQDNPAGYIEVDHVSYWRKVAAEEKEGVAAIPSLLKALKKKDLKNLASSVSHVYEASKNLFASK